MKIVLDFLNLFCSNCLDSSPNQLDNEHSFYFKKQELIKWTSFMTNQLLEARDSSMHVSLVAVQPLIG